MQMMLFFLENRIVGVVRLYHISSCAATNPSGC